MEILRIDHVVLTVRDIASTVRWYCSVLGMSHEIYGQGRHALHFGTQKLNLHERGREATPNAAHATAGSADLCLVSAVPLADVVAHLRASGIPIEIGPVARDGAIGPMRSVYVRDPDGNLIEISDYERNRDS